MPVVLLVGGLGFAMLNNQAQVLVDLLLSGVED
jgi:hypothetical protein